MYVTTAACSPCDAAVAFVAVLRVLFVAGLSTETTEGTAFPHLAMSVPEAPADIKSCRSLFPVTSLHCIVQASGAQRQIEDAVTRRLASRRGRTSLVATMLLGRAYRQEMHGASAACFIST